VGGFQWLASAAVIALGSHFEEFSVLHYISLKWISLRRIVSGRKVLFSCQKIKI
jgi:hypothetical protein